MPSVPKYRRHPNGQAFVKVKAVNDGRPYYLGKYGSEESKKNYRRVLKCIECGISLESEKATKPTTIVELIAAYLPYAEKRYTRNGQVSKEYTEQKHALRPLDELFGTIQAASFGPQRLNELRNYLIAKRLCRRVINRRVQRVRRFFRWASSTGLVPQELYAGLLSLEPLLYGQFDCREKAEIEPVPLAIVEQTIPYMVPAVAAMARIQLICAMRPTEVCIMRPCDIDRSNGIWIYQPKEHKNAWRGLSRNIALLPSAREVIEPFLDRPADSYLFSPRETLEKMVGQAGIRAGIRDHYDRESYRQAIVYAIQKAARQGVTIPHWHPLQLRHTRATEVSQILGEQAAQRLLGHKRLETTGIYSARQLKELLAIAEQLEAVAHPQLNVATPPKTSS